MFLLTLFTGLVIRLTPTSEVVEGVEGADGADAGGGHLKDASGTPGIIHVE